ncbi:MAG: biotin transporter BioY [Clostridia bacterium]|nr:biotin transporter BioY [Clostridia bacterium]
MESVKSNKAVSKLTYAAFTALTAAIIAVCAWITVPGPVPFTMQTFGVFLALRLLGGKRGSISVALYILLGAAGLPVFSGFKAGIGVLIGPTGGYILGFIFMALIYLAAEKALVNRVRVYAAMILGLSVCYAFGTVQFIFVMKTSGTVYGAVQALMLCVVPYIIPDILKMILADLTAARLGTAFKKLHE